MYANYALITLCRAIWFVFHHIFSLSYLTTLLRKHSFHITPLLVPMMATALQRTTSLQYYRARYIFAKWPLQSDSTVLTLECFPV